MLIIFGLVFQMPLIAYHLEGGHHQLQRTGKERRYAILGIVVLSAIITPPEVSSQLLMALPMSLFELSAIFARIFGRRRASRSGLTA